MKKAVKPLGLITFFCLLFASSFGQLKKFTPPSALAQDIRKVILDYPNGFANLTGELIMENPQSVEYACNFPVDGEEESTIVRYSSSGKNVYSWEAVMLTTEEFEKAKQKFRSLFNQLNNLAVQFDQVPFSLKGEYEAPVEQKKFASVVFSLAPTQEAVRKLKAEISMQYELTEWKVKVLVYGRDREDEERGERIDD